MKRYFLSATLCGALLCAPVAAQDVAQTNPAQMEEAVAVEGADAPADIAPRADAAAITTTPSVVAAAPIGGPVEGHTYFHRTGATLADQRADIEACRPAVLSMIYRPPNAGVTTTSGVYTPVYIPPTNAPISPGAAAGAGIAALLVVAVVAEAEQRAAAVRDMHLNYENCMLARGWTVMLLDEETGRPLDRLSASRLATALEPMVGAAQPVGTVSRRFANDYQFRSPSDVDEMSLSLQMMEGTYFGQRTGANDMLRSNTRDDRRRERERQERENELAERRLALFEGRKGNGAQAVEPRALGDLPEGSTLIVVGSQGPSALFVRANAQDGDGADAMFVRSSAGLQLFVVPAGEWRLTSLSEAGPSTTFCIGAPMFAANGGEVIFAGAFSPNGQPDLTLDSAREILAARPDLAERLQVASYRNGSTFECGGASFVSAFDIDGAPFVDGYTGARAVAVAASN